MKKRLRERWDSRTVFILAAIGSAIGLGNVWRFPFVAHQNGGGAFLVPYFVALITAGIPIMMLEFSLGAKMQAGAAKAFKKLKGGFEWIGWWAVLIAGVLVTYYCGIMAWAWNYLYHSLNLSWKGTEAANYVAGVTEGQFFSNEVLETTAGPSDLGGLSIPLVIGLALTWIVVYLCLRKGAESVSKVVLITVPLPWLLLVILFFRGMTLPGAFDGVRYYLTPDWGALLEPKTWLAAYGQIFFSLSLAFGVMIAYASFLPKRSDTNNNAFITSFANCGTSFFAGFVVFSVIGFLAMTQGIDPESVSGGAGLAFITYPTAISHLPTLQVAVGIFFFLMLLTLGIDSAFSLVEAVSTSVSEKFALRKSIVTPLFCVIGFLAGLIFVTRGGSYWLDIVDHYLNNYTIAIVGFLECVAIGWFGYLKVLKTHANSVSEFKAGVWWDFLIKFFTPGILIIITIFAFMDDFKAPYGASTPPDAETFYKKSAIFDASGFGSGAEGTMYEWDWTGDGSKIEESGSPIILHQYDAELGPDDEIAVLVKVIEPDREPVEVKVDGERLIQGLKAKDNKMDDFAEGFHGAAERDIQFDASEVTGAGGIVKYQWDFNADMEIDAESDQPSITHSYEHPGNTTVIVTATDSGGNLYRSAIGMGAGFSLLHRILGGWAVVGGMIVLAFILSAIKDRKSPDNPEVRDV